ncbi:MAG: glycosyltransferase family 4 protein [Deinococcota bacterium]|nr:glycosyltransferase family 4 protein [Deinococcota bacterium]
MLVAPTSITYAFFITVALGLGYWLTGRIWCYARDAGILDIPNGRSSHIKATPRGGGLSFGLIFLGSCTVFFWLLPESRALWVALLGGGALIVAIGWLDDRYDVVYRLRLAVHALAAAWVVFWLGGLGQVELGVATLPLGVLGSLLAWLGVIWLINLYNFMDGIDGLAAGQAVVVSLAAGSLLLAAGYWPLALACWTLTAATAGFLYWNWPPAKIFMGDVGSGLLGFVFAALALYTEGRGMMPLLLWILLLAPFIVDATATLLYRIAKRENWLEAHCSHAYQRAVQRGYSHLQVTSCVLLIDGVLVLLAYLAWRWPAALLPAVSVVLMALFLLWHHYTVVRVERVERVEAVDRGVGRLRLASRDKVALKK